MSSTYKIGTDVDEAVAMAEALVDYVRGDQLYGNAGGGFFSKMPSMTVGALLLRLRRLNAMRDELNSSQADKLDRAVDLYESARKEWTLHYEEKMKQEVHSRVESMNQFFKECAESPAKCANVYRPELLRRTIVQELVTEMTEMNLTDDELMGKIKVADSKLRGFVREDGFQWHEMLADVYPKREYWWLYQKPPKPTE